MSTSSPRQKTANVGGSPVRRQTMRSHAKAKDEPSEEVKAVENRRVETVTRDLEQVLETMNAQKILSVQPLILKSADPNAADKANGMTVLHHCGMAKELSKEEFTLVQLAVSAKADLNMKSGLGRAPLHCACQSDNAEVVRALVVAKADINARTTSRQTPLVVAARAGSERAVRALLENPHGTLDVHARGGSGNTTAADVAATPAIRALLGEVAQQAAGEDDEDAIFFE
mmetsp:Transcript_71441/g.190475  ORF Transcript_71441/g.190475 Transcript_71441/m.190475 type:complete len:229 (-) Transcript_71441:109-795(-)